MEGARSEDVIEISPEESIELENAEKIKDIFELDEQGKKDLAEKVKKAKGLVRVFVHPYYIYSGEDDPAPEKIDNIDKGLKIMAMTDAKNVPPVIVMEEQGKVADLSRLIAPKDFDSGISERIRNDVYVIPTVKGDSWPMADIKVMLNSRKPDKEKEWVNLIRQFKELGVQRILIGGMYLGLSGSEPVSCVGNAITHLQEDFDMELSNLTYDFRSGTPQYEEKRKLLKKKLKDKK